MDNNIELSNAQKAVFTKRLNEFKDEVNSYLKSIRADIELIKKFKQDYLEEGESEIKSQADQVFKAIQEKETLIDEKYGRILAFHNKLFENTDGEDNYSEAIESLKSNANEVFEEMTSKQRELDEFSEKVFGKIEDGKVVKIGYKHQFETKIASIDDFQKSQQNKFKAIFAQIEGLLPGATSIGLAKAFEEQKNSYEKPLNNWSIVFVITMVIMLGFGCYYFIGISKVDNLNVNQAFISLLGKLPFFVPAIWLAVFSSKKQSQYKRLQQEYAFKETFAKSYDGHKQQIDDLDYSDEEQSELLAQLLSNLVVITSDNPSKTLDNKAHNDKPPLFGILERFLPAKKLSKNDDDK